MFHKIFRLEHTSKEQILDKEPDENTTMFTHPHLKTEPVPVKKVNNIILYRTNNLIGSILYSEKEFFLFILSD